MQKKNQGPLGTREVVTGRGKSEIEKKRLRIDRREVKHL